MVVPIYKQWTANNIRIQIVEQDNIVQLLAFFEDFSHADAMNFQVKPQDEFQKSDKNGKSSVRLVDCKFALPVEERKGEGKMGKEEGRLTGWAGMKRRFVCLDQIEYPGEHDDMLITFESAESKSLFHTHVLTQTDPSSARQVCRSTPFRRGLEEVFRPQEDLAACSLTLQHCVQPVLHAAYRRTLCLLSSHQAGSAVLF